MNKFLRFCLLITLVASSAFLTQQRTAASAEIDFEPEKRHCRSLGFFPGSSDFKECVVERFKYTAKYGDHGAVTKMSESVPQISADSTTVTREPMELCLDDGHASGTNSFWNCVIEQRQTLLSNPSDKVAARPERTATREQTDQDSELLITCGASKGYTFYFGGVLVPKDAIGWREDGMSEGKFSLLAKYSSEQVNGDILALDASNVIKSASAQGAKVYVQATGDNAVAWIAFYPDGIIETYTVHLPTKTLAFWVNRAGNPLIAKQSLFTSQCDVLKSLSGVPGSVFEGP